MAKGTLKGSKLAKIIKVAHHIDCFKMIIPKFVLTQTHF